MSWLILFTLFSLPAIISGAACHSKPWFGPQNELPIFSGNDALEFINSTTHGRLYNISVPQTGPSSASTFRVLHVYGTPYQMGHAQGTLLKNTCVELVDRVWSYMESQVGGILPWLPKWLVDLIATLGLDGALDFTYYATIEYTPSHFYEELRGLADASGADYNTLVRIHLLASLTQGACSMLGGWGPSLSTNWNGKLLQLRALDWDMDGPFRDYSQITVYHPEQGNGHPFAIVGFTGFIGGLTGMSSQQLGISEIGVSYPDDTFGSESRIGLPFIYLLRDILQYDIVLDDAINRMTNARRTCDLILGVGDGKSSEFRGMQYSYSVLNVFNDKDMMPLNDTWHPRFNGVVYWGMDWLCPEDNLVLSTQIKKFYGELTPEIGIRYLSAITATGDNHVAWYDLTDMDLYVSFAAPFSSTGPRGGYARQFTKISMAALFSQTN